MNCAITHHKRTKYDTKPLNKVVRCDEYYAKRLRQLDLVDINP